MIAISAIVIETIAIIILVAYIVYANMHKEQPVDPMAEVERLRLYANFDFDKIDDRIDKYINDVGDIYKMDNFEYKDPDELYLTEDMMNEMIRWMIKEVRKKITPAIMSLIRLSYNINSEDDLVQFLYDRIRMYVLRYSFEVNAEIE